MSRCHGNEPERTGRFLDTPEFWPMRDIGNTGTIFDHLTFSVAVEAPTLEHHGGA